MDRQHFQQQTANSLQRLFKMSFIPAGFWERFIARMLISLTDMDLQVCEGSDPPVCWELHLHALWLVFVSQTAPAASIIEAQPYTALLRENREVAAAPFECGATTPSTGRRGF